MSYQKKTDNKKHKDKSQLQKDQAQSSQVINQQQPVMNYQARPHANSNSSANQSFPGTQNMESDALEKAARNGQDELLNQLLENENKTIPPRQLNMALFSAVEGCNSTKSVENHVNCINSLLAAGAQINAEKKGKTILMIAASKGYIELVSEILSRDAWVNHGDSDSKIALHYAIDNKTENLDVVNLLIEFGADRNKETTSDGFTPLIFAVNRGHVNITSILVDLGVKLDAFELNQNNTALHIACLNGQKEIVEILSNQKTFHQVFNKTNKNGQLPIDISEEKIMDMQQEMIKQGSGQGNNASTNQNQPNNVTNMYRGPNATKQKDDKQENRWWQILDYLDNLRSNIQEKAIKIGDNLISEALADEEKRLRKIEIENQQKAISQAKALEKQIIQNEKNNQRKEKQIPQHSSPEQPIDQVQNLQKQINTLNENEIQCSPNQVKNQSKTNISNSKTNSQIKRNNSADRQHNSATNKKQHPSHTHQNIPNPHHEETYQGDQPSPSAAQSMNQQQLQNYQMHQLPSQVLLGVNPGLIQMQMNGDNLGLPGSLLGGLPLQMFNANGNVQQFNGLNQLNQFQHLGQGVAGSSLNTQYIQHQLNNLSLNPLNNQVGHLLSQSPIMTPINPLQNQVYHQSTHPLPPSTAKGGLNTMNLAGGVGFPSISGTSNSTLPIRVTLDFSDEKSQNLFIYEQKYNMKKNDCFNLEKQRTVLQQQLLHRNTEYEKLQNQYKQIQSKQQNEVGVTGYKPYEQRIFQLEASHNEQLAMINHYKQMSEDKTKFSLEVVNKSMLAVDLIRKYKEEANKKGGDSARQHSKQEVDEVEEKIIQCQEAIQKDLIPMDPSFMVSNPLSLQYLKSNSQQVSALSKSPIPGQNQFGGYPFQHETHNYFNQASNILEMERRYETPLKQQPITTTITTPSIVNQGSGQVLIQNGHEVQVIPQSTLGMTIGGHVSPHHTQQIIQVQSRHNFFEIQNILHNEILLFKQDANAMLKEMQCVKDLLIQKITNLISSLIPNYFVDVYGSHATGLCLHWSDIDLVVGLKQNENDKDQPSMSMKMQDSKIKDSLRKISDCLKSEIANNWVIQVNYIDQATVPVVKIKVSLRDLMLASGIKFPNNPKYGDIYNQVFSIDITHMTDMHNGVKCVNLLKEYLLDCWFIEPLILVLKQMLKVNGLNDPYKGGLSSYGLLLMIVAFIQFRKLNKVRVPQTINLGNILLDFLHYYGEVLQFHEYGIMCRKPNDRNDSNNFYPRIPESMYQASTVPCIDDPLSPQNNVGKSTFQFLDIQKIFKVGYQSAFMGCFCDCHFPMNHDHTQTQDYSQSHAIRKPNQPFIHLPSLHPVFLDMAGSEPAVIVYQDENGNQRTLPVSSLYQQERILPQDKCDSILTKIIYSQAQFKAAEENAM